MNAQEFDGWLEFHCATFPYFAKAVSELPNRLLTMSSWRMAMEPVAVAAAMQASSELLSGTISDPPFGIQGHVTIVVGRAKEIMSADARRQVKHADEPRLKCVVCSDRGIVTVVDPKSEESSLCRASAWCSCGTGQEFSHAEGRRRDGRSPHAPPEPSLIFDPDKHIRWQWDEAVMRESLNELRSRGKDKANYETGFDEWNGGEE